MYKMDLSGQDSDITEVERRRVAESDRHKRIFNMRNRVIGVDMHALEQQVAERRRREETEKRLDSAHDLMRIYTDQKALEEQQREENKRRELARELVKYRGMYQRVQDSRDADINYSHQVALQDSMTPVESLGPASMQVFKGEGIGEDEKRRAQMETAEKALRAQKEERERLQKEQKHAVLLAHKKLVQQDLREVQLDSLEEECRRAACIALKNYNKAQAKDRVEREKHEKIKQEGEKLAEVWHTVTSDLLTECPDVEEQERPWLRSRSAEAQRVQPDRWKGMGTEQLSAIYRHREQQLAERKKLKEMEKREEMAWDLVQLQHARRQVDDDRKRRELEREKRVQLDHYNKQLAKEQQTNQQFLRNEVYTNRPTAEYFTQFNTSSR